MRISDWSSDVCSSDLRIELRDRAIDLGLIGRIRHRVGDHRAHVAHRGFPIVADRHDVDEGAVHRSRHVVEIDLRLNVAAARPCARFEAPRSEEHTSELQSLMRISYAVFCLKKKKTTHQNIKKTKRHEHKKTT